MQMKLIECSGFKFEIFDTIAFLLLSNSNCLALGCSNFLFFFVNVIIKHTNH